MRTYQKKTAKSLGAALLSLGGFSVFWAVAMALPAQAQLLQRIEKSKVLPMKNFVTWGKKGFKNVRLKLHFRSRVRPSNLIVGRDHPNGMRVLALFPKDGVDLPLHFDREFEGFDEFGDLRENYSVQVAEYDFDGDGTPEIVVAVGDGLVDLGVNVLKYHAPRLAKNAGRVSSWTLVGSFSGQQKAQIEGNRISFPFGSQGLFEEFSFTKGKFLKTD